MDEEPAALSSPLVQDPAGKRGSATRQLKSWISLNMDRQHGASGSLTHEPLSPLSYQFLLRRSSAVIEEQIEVGSHSYSLVCCEIAVSQLAQTGS